MEAFDTGRPAPEGVVDVIGVYEAPGSSAPVWVTSSGLVLPRPGGLESLPYASIREVNAPESKDQSKPESRVVRVVLEDGSTTLIEMPGGRGRFIDGFEFARFLSRCSALARRA